MSNSFLDGRNPMNDRARFVQRIVVAAIFCTAVFAWCQSAATNPQPPTVPDHIIYRHLFQEMAAFRQQADELDKQGKDGSGLRHFVHRRAGLDTLQSSTFDQIVAEYEQRVAEKDKEAH